MHMLADATAGAIRAQIAFKTALKSGSSAHRPTSLFCKTNEVKKWNT